MTTINQDQPGTVHRTETIKLAGEHLLLVEHRPERSLLKIQNGGQPVSISIEVTEKGPVLQLHGTDLVIRTDGDLAFDAERIALHGKQQLVLSCGGDAAVNVTGDLDVTARTQNITAELGNVNLRANDDVKMSGERIRMNC